MPNRHAEVCYKCGNMCEPGQGVFEKIGKAQRKKWPGLPYGKRWHVQHHECVRDYPMNAHHIHNPVEVPDAKFPLKRP